MTKTHTKLNKQEERIEKALAYKEYVKVPNIEEDKKMFQEAAKTYQELNQTKRITIRISKEDLIKIKIKAKKNDIPYQTLLKALIRQYVQGQRIIQI